MNFYMKQFFNKITEENQRNIFLIFENFNDVKQSKMLDYKIYIIYYFIIKKNFQQIVQNLTKC